METRELALAACDRALQQNVTALVDGLFHVDVTDGGRTAALQRFERRLNVYCSINREAKRLIEGAAPTTRGDHGHPDTGCVGVDVHAGLS
jgi:hypothetical protein